MGSSLSTFEVIVISLIVCLVVRCSCESNNPVHYIAENEKTAIVLMKQNCMKLCDQKTFGKVEKFKECIKVCDKLGKTNERKNKKNDRKTKRRN